MFEVDLCGGNRSLGIVFNEVDSKVSLVFHHIARTVIAKEGNPRDRVIDYLLISEVVDLREFVSKVEEFLGTMEGVE